MPHVMPPPDGFDDPEEIDAKAGPSDDESTSFVTIRGVSSIRATSLAVLVKFPGGREKWVPQSLIGEDSEVWQPGQTGALVVAEWFAKKEGLFQ